MEFYKKINIPNYELYRQEILYGIDKNLIANSRYWDIDWKEFNTFSPLFYNFIESSRLLPVRLCRFYNSPPFFRLNPHIDGTPEFKSPIGLNLPLQGCENTEMRWYYTPDENYLRGNSGFGNISATRLKDEANIKLLDSTVIDTQPTLVRTDFVHDIINWKNTNRLILSLRFYYNRTIGNEFNHIFKQHVL